MSREGNIGAPVPVDVTTRVVEFNNLPAMEAALAHGDVAAILMEPAMTNVGKTKEFVIINCPLYEGDYHNCTPN